MPMVLKLIDDARDGKLCDDAVQLYRLTNTGQLPDRDRPALAGEGQKPRYDFEVLIKYF
jgi:hypothetical protein